MRFVLFSFISLILCATVCVHAAGYGGGSGTAEDPYQIWTAQQMNTIGSNSGDWGSCFILKTHLDMSGYQGTQYRIIGNINAPFTGTFDGNGYTISNLTYTTMASVDNVGLFGFVQNAAIRNLSLKNVQLSSGGQYIGGLAGQNFGTLANCYVTGSVNGYYYVGGLTGQNSGSIHNSYATASVSGTDYIGGLIGYNKSGAVAASYAAGSISGVRCVGGLAGGSYYGTISSCYANSPVQGLRNVGGLVGYNLYGVVTACYAAGSAVGTADSYARTGGLVGGNDGMLTACYATGSVTGADQVGGLVGSNYGIITSCYAVGPVHGINNYIGGLVGFNNSSLVKQCFWDMQTSGQEASAGGTQKSTVQMKTLSTFLLADWDFVGETAIGTDDYWKMPLMGGYPVLSWQNDEESDLLGMGSPDFNGDGKADILWRNVSTGAYLGAIMDDQTLVQIKGLGGSSLTLQIVGLADFNTDGKTDLVWRNVETGTYLGTLMDGLTIVQNKGLGGSTATLQIAGLADFNADGMADILWRNVNTGAYLSTLINGLVLGQTKNLGGSSTTLQIVE